MPNTPFSYPLPTKHIANIAASEQLCVDNPRALELARPLFAAGLRIAAITERREYHTDPGEKAIPRRVHLFTLLLQGELWMDVGNDHLHISPGQLVYNPPMTPSMRIGKKNNELWFLYIELFDVPQWEGLKANGPFVRDYEYADLMFLLLRRILDSYHTHMNLNLTSAHSKMLVELLRHESKSISTIPKRQQSALRALVEEISLHPEAPWTTTEMARQLYMSRATLTRLFQTEYSVPPKTMVIKQRIAKAMELLDTTNDTVDSIAHEVGYESTATFSNLFKQQTGKRPGQFRKMPTEAESMGNSH